jgi:adenylosuccinate lyase
VSILLGALSPLDGRYKQQVAPLAAHFSESALIRQRAGIELAWLKTLAPLFDFSRDTDLAKLYSIVVDDNAAAAIKDIEKTTRHDVKAVEYWLTTRLQELRLTELCPLTHFGCTSWDINNIALARMVTGALQETMSPALADIISALRQRADKCATQPMLARTHGQPASPTTVGKEFANFAARLSPRAQKIAICRLPGKMNGAVGNYNAHIVARADLDWPRIAKTFVESQGLRFASHTTQIEPYDDLADLFGLLRGVNIILLDFCRDMWGYIALDYFVQQAVAGEVGSSTMPHKINPIDFENAEGNIGVANALFSHFSDKLPVSRWQRDLSDSTVLRNIGTAFGHTLLAWSAVLRGLQRVTLNRQVLENDLDANWQVLAEAVQTVIRAENAGDNAYEQLKEFSRGATVDKERLQAFIHKLPVSDGAKARLLALTPRDYCGIAARLAQETA